MLYEFRWKEPTPQKDRPNRKEPCRAYRDPTADKAIANVMCEKKGARK